MEVIPVLDLAHGLAVHARAGHRERYRPVVSALAPDARGNPVALIEAYRNRLGATTCYIADLDAIQGEALQGALLRELTSPGSDCAQATLIDAGAHSVDAALEVLACGASQVVIGLESLRAFADLADIVRAVGSEHVVFSLDLRNGIPLLHRELRDADGAWPPDPISLTAKAVDLGVRTLIVLDLASIGTGSGADLGLLGELRRRFPSVRLLAGGGVLARSDLNWMRGAGCDGALVASAIHAGSIAAADLAALSDDPVREGHWLEPGEQAPSLRSGGRLIDP